MRITKDFIKNHKFKFDGLNFPQEFEENNFRLRAGMFLPPSVELQIIEVRKKLSSIVAKNYENFAQIEVSCDINESTMRKCLNGRRKITRETLAKFCIGTKLTVEQSEELFTLQGHSLEPETQLFDALIVNALQDGDDIEIFLKLAKNAD